MGLPNPDVVSATISKQIIPPFHLFLPPPQSLELLVEKYFHQTLNAKESFNSPLSLPTILTSHPSLSAVAGNYDTKMHDLNTCISRGEHFFQKSRERENIF